MLRPNFEKRDGLVTVVAQDASTHEILMVAYTDEPGWRKTLETGLGTYYSTSRKESWIKGEISNNRQKVVDMLVDCDGDALIYLVEPLGNKVACHLDSRSCFARGIDNWWVMDVPKAKDLDVLQRVEITVHKNFNDMHDRQSWIREKP